MLSCEKPAQNTVTTEPPDTAKTSVLTFSKLCDSLLNSDYDRVPAQKVKKDQMFNIMGNLPLDSGQWTVMVEADGWTDSFLYASFGLSAKGYYLSEDIHLIKQMANDFKVKVRGDDCCTPDINLNFFQDGRMRLSLGVLLKGSSDSLWGFQTELYGFTPFTKYLSLKPYAPRFTYCKVPEAEKLK